MSRARVDVEVVELRLLGAHVLQRADDGAEVGEQRALGQLLAGRLGDAEVDDLRHRLAVVQRDQHVRRLEVAVNDPFLMGVLHGLADRHEQFQPLARRELMLVAVLGDRHAFDQFHHEVRPAGVGRAGVEHLGDVRMVHQRQRLPLGLEAGDAPAACPCPALMILSATVRRTGSRLLGHEDARPCRLRRSVRSSL